MGVGGIQVIAVLGVALLAGGCITSCIGLYKIISAKKIGVLGIGIGLAMAGGVFLWIAHKASSSV
jgi:hypothetical protein